MGGTCSSSNATATQGKQTPQQTNKPDDKPAESKPPADEPVQTADEPDAGQVQTQADDKCLDSSGYPSTHVKCRNSLYSRTTDIQRCDVPDDKIKWSVEYPDYKPVEFFAIQEVPIEEDVDFR